MAYEIREYTDESEENLFRQWFLNLNARAAAKVTTAIVQLENGNIANAKSVGNGVYEYEINFGPRYIIYFSYDSETIITLLAGDRV